VTSSSGAVATLPSRDTVLAALRVNLQGALLSYSTLHGWPVAVQEGGYLVVTTENLGFVAGDFGPWCTTPTPLTQDTGFKWAVVQAAANDKYKLSDCGNTYVADPWARSYNVDENGEISIIRATTRHFDRWLRVGDAQMEPRTLRVLVPGEPITHVLYVHDGQNLFDRNAIWGGWRLDETAPADMLVVGIDNTGARMDEYTHVQDRISGTLLGGEGDAYADFVKFTVRPLVRDNYGETGPVGVMGSSLGGLISLHMADRHPGDYAFAASLSGTFGWGSIGATIHNPTMMDRYAEHGRQTTVLYLDSGGGGPCADTDSDGVNDDGTGGDNYCETIQLRDVLVSEGYVHAVDLHHWHEPSAEHNEAAWAARVFRPLGIFDGL